MRAALLIASALASATCMVIGPVTSKVEVTGSGALQVTPPLRAYAEDKCGKMVERYDGFLTGCNVLLKVEHRCGAQADACTYSVHIGEVTALCKDRQVLRVTSESDNMYATIDKVSDLLARKLRKYKERKKARSEGVAIKDLTADLEEEEEEDEGEAMMEGMPVDEAGVLLASKPWEVVREKSFPMPPMSVDEATLCLEYIDHPFYVFRNAETDIINVVYRRKSGGVGLIQPEDQ